MTILANINRDQLTVAGNVTDGNIVVKLVGTADTEVRENLDEYIKGVHAEAQRLHSPKVIVDFRELEFMNSSCLKIFVSWLAQLRELETTEQYKVHILSNSSRLWQRRSLAALSCFAIDLVTIEA